MVQANVTIVATLLTLGPRTRLLPTSSDRNPANGIIVNFDATR